MSTRSLIAKETKDGAFEAIYCHHDGYPEHHGPILTQHYATEKAVDALLALGSLSRLGRALGTAKDDPSTHLTAAIEGKRCLAYGRDQGEKDQGKRLYQHEKDLLEAADDSWADYIYLFRDGRWFFRRNRPEQVWHALKTDWNTD